jgi:predicted metal-dependent phosphoesterase TrpH
MKLGIIGITDHNSAENVPATIKAAEGTKLTVIPGMEITSAEEVHIIGLFEKISNALTVQNIVYKNLILKENKANLFGEQIVANEFDEVEGYNKRLLIGATKLTLKEVVNKIHKSGGLAIASHIDRESYSIIGQLGFIPENLELDAVEISPNTTIEKAIEKFPEIKKMPKITCSDAHFLKDIGRATTSFLLEGPTVDEIRNAFENRDGRKIII